MQPSIPAFLTIRHMKTGLEIIPGNEISEDCRHLFISVNKKFSGIYYEMNVYRLIGDFY